MSDSNYQVMRPRPESGVIEIVKGGATNPKGGHPPHWHAEWQLVAVTRGDGWVRMRGSTHRTPAGSLFLVPPETVHSNDMFEGGCDFRSMLIAPGTIDQILEANGLQPRRLAIEKSPVIISRKRTSQYSGFHEDLEHHHSPMEIDFRLDAWVSGIISQLTEQNPTPAAVSHPAARRARAYLADRAAEEVSLEDLSLECGLSRYELCRQFKSAYGMPPHAWQLQVRIARAKQLIRNGSSLSDTALDLGFSDQSHFSRAFKRATGYTPGTYRRAFIRNPVQD